MSIFFWLGFSAAFIGAVLGFFTGVWSKETSLDDEIDTGEIRIKGKRYWITPAGRAVFPPYANENGPFPTAHTHDPFTH